MKSYDVVIAGDVFCDLIFTGLPRMPQLGEELFSTAFDIVPGGVYITAVTLRRLGLSVGVFCHMGSDPFSRFVVEQMEAEGRAKELKGEAKQESAKAAGRAEGKVNEVVGAVKNRVGAVIGNEQMQAEGKVKELKGEAKQKANE